MFLLGVLYSIFARLLRSEIAYKFDYTFFNYIDFSLNKSSIYGFRGLWSYLDPFSIYFYFLLGDFKVVGLYYIGGHKNSLILADLRITYFYLRFNCCLHYSNCGICDEASTEICPFYPCEIIISIYLFAKIALFINPKTLTSNINSLPIPLHILTA